MTNYFPNTLKAELMLQSHICLLLTLWCTILFSNMTDNAFVIRICQKKDNTFKHNKTNKAMLNK